MLSLTSRGVTNTAFQKKVGSTFAKNKKLSLGSETQPYISAKTRRFVGSSSTTEWGLCGIKGGMYKATPQNPLPGIPGGERKGLPQIQKGQQGLLGNGEENLHFIPEPLVGIAKCWAGSTIKKSVSENDSR